jgi:hypothetical protein
VNGDSKRVVGRKHLLAQSPVCNRSGGQSSSNAQAVRDATVTALSLINPTQDESNNVQPGSDNFANVQNSTAINTTGWTSEFSIHSSNATESPPVPGFPAYAVKMYDGKSIAVTYPTASPMHWLSAVPFIAGFPVNSRIARGFLSAACP